MKALILSVGDEILSGKTINTNASTIALELEKIGVEVSRVISVGDNKDDISEVTTSFLNSDIEVMITTGGLGPTHDDFTKEVISDTIKRPLEINEQAKQDMYNYFHEEKHDSNLKQIYYPKGANIITNEIGSADGFYINVDKKTIFVLVGVPFEMEAMLKKGVIPVLKKCGNDKLCQDYIVMGSTESALENILVPFMEKFPHISLAPYCAPGMIRYRILSNKEDENEFRNCIKQFKKLLGNKIISDSDQKIEEVIVEKLKQQKLTISCGESCTGGLIASTLINVCGASEVIKESYITYSNEAKHKILHVSYDTINKYGVVSEEVALEMVRGLFAITNSDICISVTGYAGPSGDKGRVCYAIKYKDKVIVEEKRFQGTRYLVRIRAKRWILYRLNCLLGEN